jgi:hypothetical protein
MRGNTQPIRFYPVSRLPPLSRRVFFLARQCPQVDYKVFKQDTSQSGTTCRLLTPNTGMGAVKRWLAGSSAMMKMIPPVIPPTCPLLTRLNPKRPGIFQFFSVKILDVEESHMLKYAL